MIKVDVAKAYFQDKEGKIDLDSSLLLSGRFAGVCYDLEGFNHLINEDIEKTRRRIVMTKDNGHHSVYDHIYMSLNIIGIPKILAMVINNEKEYTTSEKSARYTPVKPGPDSVITEKEVELYEKWMQIFQAKIKEQYGDVFKDGKIKKLAQENARYLVTVFMPTAMIYTVSLRQINYIYSWMKDYIEKHDVSDDFQEKLSSAMKEFMIALEKLNVIDAGLTQNEKNRYFSLFGHGLDKKEEYFGEVYAARYEASFAEVAQAQRHRTLDYQIEFMDDKKYFVPPIIADDEELVSEWLHDMNEVKNVTPQGELVKVFERGTRENFILKCKERLCSAAQLEIMLKTQETLLRYYEALKEKNSDLVEEFEPYTHGARCTFGDFTCTQPCMFKEGINLTRKI